MDPPPPSSGPLLLHPDILPLILSSCPDITLARLMRVSRFFLSTIVSLRYPCISLDPSPTSRRAAIKTRNTLPDQPHWFSAAMQLLLARYTRIIKIGPHPAYACPPRMVRSDQVPMARTLCVDRRGLCRSDHMKFGNEITATCGLCSVFEPTTLRIDHINQHPLLSTPYGLSFAPALSRLLLMIDPNVPTSTASDGPLLYEKIPDHVSDIVFIFAHPTQDRITKKGPSVSLKGLCKALARWVKAGEVVEGRTWTIIGAERFGKIWAIPGQNDIGAEAVRKGMTAEAGLKLMDRVKFIPLKSYLLGIQIKSEFTLEEISRMAANERERTGKKRRMPKSDEGVYEG